MSHSIRTFRGFTLIELLVVIAIIGLLSAIVLASLQVARNKGNLGTVKSQLAQVRPSADLLFDKYNCYSGTGTCYTTSVKGTCTTILDVANTQYKDTIYQDAKISGMIYSALKSGGKYATCAQYKGTSFAIAVQSPDDATKAWCVDSTGAATTTTLSSNNQTGVNAVIGSKTAQGITVYGCL